jgi:hypothetical protein
MLASEHPWVRAYFRGKRARVLVHEPNALQIEAH